MRLALAFVRRYPIQIAVGVVAFLFVCFVWPTPYRYEHVGNNLVRVNRFTGNAVIMVNSRGQTW